MATEDRERDGDKDRYLPIANISRLMKSVLPENSKTTKEAREAVQDCVSEFICFITGVAAEACSRDKRKTIHASDLINAMKQLGFTDYVAVLEPYYDRWETSAANKSRKNKAGRSSSE